MNIALVALFSAPSVSYEVELSAHDPKTLARLGGGTAQLSVDIDASPLKGFTAARALKLVREVRGAMGEPPPLFQVPTM